MQYEIFDDLLPQSFVDTIEDAFNQPVPWYYTESASGIGANYDMNDKNILDSSQFVHMIMDDNERQSQLYELVQPVFYFIEQRTGLRPRKIERIKANLQTPGKSETHNYNPPHIDVAEPSGMTLLYYINDSDGDTKFFNNNIEQGYNNMEVIESVTPKRGRSVLFPSNQFHSSSAPQNGRRMVINFIFHI